MAGVHQTPRLSPATVKSSVEKSVKELKK